jgi:hypothetical protein
MRNGVLYRRPPLVRITREIVSGLLPTPRASRSSYNYSHGKIVYNLPGMARFNLWPTPTVNDAQNSNLAPSQLKRRSLIGEIMRSFPTPSANGFGNEGSRKILKDRVEDGTICPDEKRKMEAGHGGQLNPNWVEWLMGWPIGWTDLQPLAMDKYRTWLELHGNYSQPE